MNIDLHCHSTVSDGLLHPDEVARLAHAKGVDVWALTDHDEISGLKLAQETARKIGLKFVNGVEISVTWANTTVHIVGLQIDPNNQQLVSGLMHTRSGRNRRAHEIADQLAAVGITKAYEGALKFVGNKDLISRSHFARYIVETGTCNHIHEVFTRYLVEGKPGFVPHSWATLSNAITWIRNAGGVAVIAHPARYNLNDQQFSNFIDEFKQLGGTGIEVITGSHTPSEYRAYAKVAKKYQLKASRGSDYHGPGESDAELGALPPLPDSLTPIWDDWF